MEDSSGIKLVIFDLDSTMVKLEVPWDQLKEEAIQMAREYGIDVDGSLPMMEVSNLLDEYPDAKEPLYHLFKRYEARCVEGEAYYVYPGIRELVHDLKEKGYQLAVASANCQSTVEEVLQAAGLLDSFDAALGREKAGRNKPSPSQLNNILGELNAAKESTLMVGDSRYDEGAAEAAGVKFFNISGHGNRVEELRQMLLD
ncbi:HAD hydrolase-like protein [Candidatus Micrarchaeota archaeon]|nr:HAD hydrolase-like protein [Candidatus Micrarchaeota archaeon]